MIRRRLSICCALATAVLLPAHVAAATRPTDLTQEVNSEHFVVHYTTEGKNRVTAKRALSIAARAERAYVIEVGRWGFALPTSDGDDKTDVYIYRCGAQGKTYAEGTSAWVCLSPKAKVNTISHELFHLLQRASTGGAKRWLKESTAELAEALVSAELGGGSPAVPAFTLYPEISLECATSSCWKKTLPYRQWPFFSHITERYGTAAIREILEKANAGSDSLDAIDQTLAAHGSSLQQTFINYATTTALGTHGLSLAKGRQPRYDQTERLRSGTTTVFKRLVGIDHLAARYLRFEGDRGGGCGARQLRVLLRVPEDSPLSFALTQAGRVFKPSTDEGRRLVYTIQFDPCAQPVTLAAINPDRTSNAQAVGVYATYGSAVPKLTVLEAKRTDAGVQLDLQSTQPGTLKISLGRGRRVTTRHLPQGSRSFTVFVPEELRRGKLELALTPLSVTDEAGRATRLTVKFD